MIALVSVAGGAVAEAEREAESAGLDAAELYATAVFDALALIDGGEDPGFEVPARYDLGVVLDTAAAGWWNGGLFHMSLMGTSGGSPSRRIGDLQTVSSVDAPNTFKLYSAYIEQAFGDLFALLLGLHDLNTEFYVLDSSGLFLNSSFGNGPEISQVNPSIFPTTAPTARLRASLPVRGGYLLAAVYDGVPGNPHDPYGTHIEFAAGDGVLAIVESGVSDPAAGYKLGLGVWHHTATFDDVAGRSRNKNTGGYVIGERTLADGSSVWPATRVFAQIGLAQSDRNQLSSYFGAGATWLGLAPGRPDDVLGLAVAHARQSDRFIARYAGAERAETAIELTYLATLSDHLAFQPDLQFVIEPGADGRSGHAWVLGARVMLSF